MPDQENLRLVQELYAAFGRGDVPAILEQLTDDVLWYDPGPPEVPHAGRYGGPEEVGMFFGRLAETLDIEEFAPTEFLAQADRVVVLGSIRARVKDTGRTYDNEWAMAWTLPGAGGILRPVPYTVVKAELDRYAAGLRRRSDWLARRIARSIRGAPTFAKPLGSPRFRSVIRVPRGVSSNV